MSNPIITRLSKTQLWYKNWYSSNKYSSVLKKATTFESLLSFYINYGLKFQKPILYNKVWYKSTNKHLFPSESRYYRKYHYTNKTLTIEHSYFIRSKTPEYFPLRLHVLRYNNWLCATLQWFKPLKSTHKFKSNHFNKLKNKNQAIITNKKLPTTTPRIKILIFLLKKTLNSNKKHIKYVF